MPNNIMVLKSEDGTTMKLDQREDGVYVITDAFGKEPFQSRNRDRAVTEFRELAIDFITSFIDKAV